MEKKTGIQNLNSSLIVQFQVSVNQQEPRIQKRQIYSCQGMGNIELPSQLKKLEKPHEQEIVQLYYLIEKINIEIQTLKAENQNLKLLLQAKKWKIKASLNFQIYIGRKKTSSKAIENRRKVQLKIKKVLISTDKIEIEPKILQQNVVIAVKRLEIYGDNVCSEKECLSSIENNLKHRGGYDETALELSTRKKLVVVDSNVTILKQDLDNEQYQNKQLQKDNDDLRIDLEKLEKNQKKMEEQFYELIEEQEELSQFEIDSDEDMCS